MARAFTTGWRRIKPRRPYANFRLFCLAHGGDSTCPYPCLACRGRGNVFDPADPPCPIEGNRYRRTVLCAACGGSGQGTKKACQDAYRDAIQTFQAEKEEYNRLVRARQQALKRLTDEEIKALRELGV